ncbi:hypothetical protein BDA99DRAFT_524283 [Phascolomyces articulosus]|uniref:CCR4-NOT transcription complex subunit 11 n=1 Tax=Phascolomyces articulosus TaxID=60185 RepID=A0AAD5JPX8_9FUNG|nr:hypothetical protein BDA99DRAFT_524283 [Phascolomyces articulosus]
MLYDPSLPFTTVYHLFREQTTQHTPFTAGCNAFLVYDETKESTDKLLILYILYALYADTTLERNPFLTFFLEFVSGEHQRGNALEQQFVYCILEGSIVKIKERTPKQVCDNTLETLPKTNTSVQRLNELENSVARLIGDPLTTTLLPSLKDQSIIGSETFAETIQLIHDACIRTLTIPEQQFVQNAFKSDAPMVVTHCGLSPEKLRDLVETNHILAMDVVPLFLEQVNDKEYLYGLAKVPVGNTSVELVYHLLTSSHHSRSDGSIGGMGNVGDFLHMYISNSIRTCELYEEGPRKDKHVRLVAKFIQSLLEKGIIPIAEYLIEIQSFCVGYFRFKGVATLFQLASSEAQRMGFEVDRQLQHQVAI